MGVGIALLGEVTAHVDGRLVALGPARQRCVLAALAVDVGRLVPSDRLVGRVWGADTPRRGRATLHSYISRLRSAFGGAVAIAHRSGGYTLAVDRADQAADQAVDLLWFRDLRDRVRGADDTRKVALLTEALALWRGEPLTGLSGEWVESERDRWQQERTGAEHDLVDARLAIGQGEQLVAPLSARTTQNPLDERAAGQFMLALYRSGRQADALDHYQRLRARLADELGTDPDPGLQQLHQRILTADPGLTESTAGTDRSPVVPRQLPAAPGLFTGRVTELVELDRTLTVSPDGRRDANPPDTSPEIPQASGATVRVVAIGGAGGIGKTWLALTWAHRWADWFPDGQLFVDLHGFSSAGEPVEPAVALRGFLDVLGVGPDRIPTDFDAQAALYRSLVSDRRMLVVLDNAAAAEQIVPLLPGSPTCTVLVTSRHRLASVIDRHGARHLHLGILDHADARALLTVRLGAGRVAADPGTVDELVRLCGGHPLALSITARTVASRSAVPPAEVAAELRELGLEMLDHDTDPAASLPSVLSWSLRRLTHRQCTVFALLGIAPGIDTTSPATAALAGLSAAAARRTLAALEDASLLERRPGGRYAMHDLVRAYAATTAHNLPDDVREAALSRVVDFHLHTAHAADRLLNPYRTLAHPGPVAPDVRPQPLSDAETAMVWLEAEHPTLLAIQHAAVALGRHRAVWHMAWALHTFHFRRGHRRDALATWQAALAAADHLPDPTTRICAHRLLGRVCARLGRYEEATGHLESALVLALKHHDTAEQAHIHRALAILWGLRGDELRALEHARRALAFYRSFDQPLWKAAALNAVGWHAARLGEFDTARDHCHAALTLHRHHHDLDGEAYALVSFGFIAHRTGDHHQALDHYQQALALRRLLGHTYQAADTLDHLGHPHAALGQHEWARAVWREALQMYREQGRDEDAERVQRQLDDSDNTCRADTDNQRRRCRNNP